MDLRQIIFKSAKQFKFIIFPIIGLASLLWFLVRVIPKPSRAGYPCMRVAYPLASGFMLYVVSLMMTVISWRKFKESVFRNQYWLAAIFFSTMLVSGFWFMHQSHPSLALNGVTIAEHVANAPMGIGKGIHPGRVVWMYDPDATNSNCNGMLVKDGVIDNKDNLWFQAKNNDVNVITKMVSKSITALIGVDSSSQAWELLFRHFNEQKGRGKVGYSPGEKILIKTNATSAWGEPGRWGMYNLDLSKTESWRPDIAETNPYVVLALLRELVYNAGVPQSDIYVGDPMKQVYKEFYTLLRAEFPDVHYLGNRVLPNYAAVDIVALGRTPVVKSDTASLFYSDQGKVLDSASDKLYTILEQADYLINVPTLKAHARAGITLAAKNHFGSHTHDNAEHLHNGLVSEPPHNDKPTRTDYGLYRVQVDIMAHKYLGANTMLVLVDGLYPSDEAVNSPGKWKMAPFNNDWTSSIFVSQDQVAIESVCHDFLRTEYNGSTPETSRPSWPGVDDYLHQAADSANWPANVKYDPNHNGVYFASLGTHEHWNNGIDKQYSRNLGKNEGVELVSIMGVQTAVDHDPPPQSPCSFSLMQNYPNPFNGQTRISFALDSSGETLLAVYDQTGRRVRTLQQGLLNAGLHHAIWEGTDDQGRPAASGLYLYQIRIIQEDQTIHSYTKRMLLVK